MKIKDKYSISFEIEKHHSFISDKDIEALSYIIKNKDLTNDILEQIADIAKIYFNNYRWKYSISQYPAKVFTKQAYVIELTKDRDINWSLRINLLEK